MLFYSHSNPNGFIWVTNTHGPSPSQQNTGLQHVDFQLQHEVTTPNAKFKPTIPERSEVEG